MAGESTLIFKLLFVSLRTKVTPTDNQLYSFIPGYLLIVFYLLTGSVFLFQSNFFYNFRKAEITNIPKTPYQILPRCPLVYTHGWLRIAALYLRFVLIAVGVEIEERISLSVSALKFSTPVSR